MNTHSKQLQEKLWAAAEQLRANGSLKLNEISEPILGLSGKIELANSYYEDLHHSIGKFDFVLANPPFNVKGKDKNKQIVIDPARLHGDKRYSFGLPLTGKGEISNANYLWMQIFAGALSPRGRAGFVMANSAGDAGNAEKEIRRKMIDEGIVDVIISVGTNMFLNATLSCTLWFFDKSKAGSSRQNQVLFINAQDIFTEIDRAHSTWTDEQIHEIADIVRRYRKEEDYGKYKDIKGRCKAAALDEIRANDYSLNPGRYVEIIEKEMDNIDFQARMKELMGEWTALTSEARKLEKKITDDWGKIL